jgi:hypothetical protein
VPGPNGFSFGGAGGTSASSPAFAGIMALINQNNGLQGNANPVLYKIATTAGQSCNSSTTPLTGSATCSFYDVTKGNNSVPCAGNSPNCSSTTTGTNGVLVSAASPTTPAWTTATGYDLATGLGSVNVANLATQWPTAVGTFHGTTTSLTLNSGAAVNITHGTAVSAKVTVTSTFAGTPSGDVSLLAPTTVNGGVGDVPLSGGVANITGVILPGGTYSVNARYAGDTTFAASTSTPGVPVVVNKENSRLQIGIVTMSGNTILSTNATSFAYGSPYILRIDILNSLGTATNCQPVIQTNNPGCAFDATGTVTITDNGSPLDTGTFKINSAGSAEDQPIQLTGGTHTLSATYSGDISYNPVATAVTDTVTVSKATTATGLAASPTTVATGANVTLTATISSASNSLVGATGTVTFFNGGTQIGSPVAVAPTAAGTVGAGGTAALTTSFSSAGTQSITATYNGDTNYALSSATAITVTVSSTGSFTMTATAPTVTTAPAAAGTMATANSTITLTPSGGFAGAVIVTCPVAANLPPGVTCSPLTIPSGSTSGALAINVLDPSSSLTAMVAPATQNLWAANRPAKHRDANGWWTLSASTGFATLLLLFLPGRKRYRAALGLGLVCLLSFTLGCNSSNGGGGGAVATTTKITVTSAKAASGVNISFSIAVNATKAANGQVQLFDGSTALGTAVSVSNGSATIMNGSLPVGTHAISAHYLGDTSTQASQSGALNVTVTGTTPPITITGTSGSTTATTTLSVTIN